MNDSRSYIAAIGSSAALLGAIVIACATLGGIVASGGFPGASGSSGSTSVTVPESEQGVLFASADTPLDPGLNVGDGPAAGPDAAGGPGNDGGNGGGGNNGTDGAGGGDPSGGDTGGGDTGSGDTGSGETDGATDPGDGGTDPGSGGDPGQPPVESETPDGPAAGTQPTGSRGGGPLGTTVRGVDDAVGGLTGVNPGLDNVTAPITGTLDGVLGSLNGGAAETAATPVPETPAP